MCCNVKEVAYDYLINYVTGTCILMNVQFVTKPLYVLLPTDQEVGVCIFGEIRRGTTGFGSAFYQYIPKRTQGKCIVSQKNVIIKIK